MNQSDQQIAFSEALERLVHRFCSEFELTYESMIGCLEIQKAYLIHDLNRYHESDEENEEG